jgi:hypothetical protein
MERDKGEDVYYEEKEREQGNNIEKKRSWKEISKEKWTSTKRKTKGNKWSLH